jgi:hypothetical protein
MDVPALQAQRELLRAQAADLARRRRALSDERRRPPGRRQKRPRTEAVAHRVAALLGAEEGPGAAAVLVRQALGRRSPSTTRSAEAASATMPAGTHPGAGHDEVPSPAPARSPSPAPAEPEGGAGPATARAHRFLRERALHRWVAELNNEAGLAPNHDALWQTWRSGEVAALGFQAAAAPTLKSQRQWARRWRRRWRVGLRALPPGPGLSRQTLVDKATAGTPGARENTPRVWPLAKTVGPHSGPCHCVAQ